jgi:hypothetical protein
MALSYKARRRWALVILLVGLPLYVVAAVNVVDLFDRPSFLVELWSTWRWAFSGRCRSASSSGASARPDPDAKKTDGQGPSV